MNFIGFYGVLLEFEKRMGVNMQEINSKLWIMVELWRGLKSKGDATPESLNPSVQFKVFIYALPILLTSDRNGTFVDRS